MLLLNYCFFRKCKIPFLLLKRALGIGAKKNTSYVKRIGFFALFVYKTSRQNVHKRKASLAVNRFQVSLDDEIELVHQAPHLIERLY